MKNETNYPEMTRRSLLGRMAAAGLALAVGGVGTLAQAQGKTWNKGFELAIDFELNQPGGRYHRPYVAVYIEDANGKAVRTLALWMQTIKPGPRWFPNLKRWYRKEQARKKENGGDLIDVLSSATKPAGKYSVVWNGRNDDGELLPQGTYTVCLEAAREAGTYQIIREEFSFGAQPFSKNLPSNIEIKEASVAYRKKK